MELHNALSRLTEIQRGAKIAFGLDSGAGGLERLGETLQIVKDFWSHPEDAYLRGERLCQGCITVPAGGAGNYSAASFAIQVGGWIATLKHAIVTTTGNASIVVKRGLPLPTNSANKVFRDMRATGNPVGVVAYVNNVAAIPGGTIAHYARTLANTPVLIPLDWVLCAQGPVATETACVIYSDVVDTAVEVNFAWAERNLLPGELYR